MRDQIIDTLRHELLWGGDFLILPQKPAAKKLDMQAIQEEVQACQKCPLAKTRKNVVFGEGNPHARIMFIGEAPGATEDSTGRPFVGRAGALLTDIIEKGMGIKRSEVYIANILKCRPPENRDPLPNEAGECIGFLKEQIRSVKPEVIIALGRIAAQNLLVTDTPISKLRGTWAEYMGIKVMPTYHPSYLLQNPSKKRDVWEDIKKVLTYLGLSAPRLRG